MLGKASSVLKKPLVCDVRPNRGAEDVPRGGKWDGLLSKQRR